MGPRTGAVAHLFYGERVFLVLRDKNERTVFPGCWDSITETLENGKSFVICMKRGLREEIGLVPIFLRMLGITRAGHGFFYGILTDVEKESLVLGNEGQAFAFFTLPELGKLKLGGAIGYHLEAYPEAFGKMFRGITPSPSELGLRILT